MQSTRFLVGAIGLVSLLGGCGAGRSAPMPPPLQPGPAGTGATTMAMIGVAGGTVALADTTLAIPAGALDGPTAITIASPADAPPATLENVTPIVVFGPDGTQFAAPVAVTMAVAGNPDDLEILWTNRDGDFEAIDTISGDGAVVGQIDHFSRGTLKRRPLFSGQRSPLEQNLTATIDRQSAVADGRDMIRVVLTLVDDRGRGVGGQRLVVTASGEQNHVVQPRATQMATGTTYALIASTAAGKKDLTVEVLGLRQAIGQVSFTPRAPGAADPDRCALATDDCSPWARCTDLPDGFRCDCPSGFVGDGKICSDIDECANGSADCDVHATCYNRAGGFLCACQSGWIGDGKSCTHSDDCAVNNGGCDANAACLPTPTGHSCACNPGWTGDGTSCRDIDECATGNGGCDANATCTNTPGGRGCTCKLGWTGDGISCHPVDACAFNNGDCDANAICTNQTGGRSCACKSGFTGDGTQLTRNGSFETDSFVDWTAVGDLTNVQDPVAAGESTTNPFSGRYVARVRSSTGDGSLTQTLALIDATRSYSVSVDLGMRHFWSASYEVQLLADGAVLKSASGTVTGTVFGSLSKQLTVTLAAAPADLVGRAGQALALRVINHTSGEHLIVDNARTNGGCVDIDECAAGGACDANASCSNSIGSFSCSCNAGPGSGANLVVDPGFELSGWSGWTSVSGSDAVVDPVAAGLAAVNPFSGRYVARLHGGWIEQAIGSIDATKTYSVTVDLGAFAQARPAYEVQLRAGGSVVRLSSGIAAGGASGVLAKVKTVSVAVAPPDLVGRNGQPLAVRISNGDGTNDLYVDNVRSGGFGCAAPAVDECADTSNTCDLRATCAVSASGYSCTCPNGTSGSGGGTPLNPSFESGTVAGWTAFGDLTRVINPIAIGAANNPFSGSYVAELRNSAPATPASLQQTLGAIDATRSYSVSVDLGVFDRATVAYAVQLWGGGTLLASDGGSLTGTAPNLFSKVKTVQLTATPAALGSCAGQPLSIVILASTSSDYLIVDNVRSTGFGCF
jgi:hypothetical protein